MKKMLWMCLLMAWLPFNVCAAYNDQQVAYWVSEILKDSLSISYKDTDQDIRKTKKYFSSNAWDGISAFLGDKVVQVRAYKITTKPTPLQGPRVLESGQYQGVPYWRVTQGWELTNLNSKIWFSVTVVQQSETNLYIDSVSMSKAPVNLP